MSMEQQARAYLNDLIEKGIKVRTALAVRMTDGPDGSLCGWADWGNEELKIDWMSHLAARTLQSLEKRLPEGESVESVLRHHVYYYAKSLLDNQLRHNSTSALENAVNEMKRDAVSSYVFSLSSICGFYPMAEWEEKSDADV